MIEAITKTLEKFNKKIPIGIKVKPKFYDELLKQCQAVNQISTEKIHSIDTFHSLKVVIDNDIKNDYEFVYEG